MPKADLVLDGGGVKGTGLVGAISALVERDDPYVFERIAGTSAGAIVGSMLAAGLHPDEIKELMFELDFTRFEDEPPLFDHARHLGAILGLLLHEGMYLGDYMHEWISTVLERQGVRTWADLRYNDPHGALAPERRYKLVVIVSDVSRGLMLRLPWDYEELLGVDPDIQLVADAVRASASTPFFFEPMRLATDTAAIGHPHIVCLDGGLLASYPINLFDRVDGKVPRWPTIGVKLSAYAPVRTEQWSPDANDLQLATSILSTLLNAHDREYIANPAFSSRTIFVDTTGFSTTNFSLSAEGKRTLFANGQRSGERFLARWNWDAWKRGDYAALLAPLNSGPAARDTAKS